MRGFGSTREEWAQNGASIMPSATVHVMPAFCARDAVFDTTPTPTPGARLADTVTPLPFGGVHARPVSTFTTPNWPFAMPDPGVHDAGIRPFTTRRSRSSRCRDICSPAESPRGALNCRAYERGPQCGCRGRPPAARVAHEALGRLPSEPGAVVDLNAEREWQR
jgi:hypothetical protein